jgi:hypothetical protein
MASISQPPEGRDVVLPTLDVSIQDLNIAKNACAVAPAQFALSSASTLLTMIRVRFPLQIPTVNLCLSRTPWPTIRIMSTLDIIAVMCAKYSTGDWTGSGRMNSARPSSMRLEIWLRESDQRCGRQVTDALTDDHRSQIRGGDAEERQ